MFVYTATGRNKMNIREIAKEYNGNIDEANEHKITNKTVQYALMVEKEFFDFSIDGYDIVPSYLGELYFEWDSKEVSFGVAIHENKATLECLSKTNDADTYIESYDLDDRESVEDLIQVVSDFLYGC